MIDRRQFLGFATAGLFIRPVIAGPAISSPLYIEGVPNLHSVSHNLYRSAQPTAAGFQHLSKFGIRTVINLRQSVDDAPLADGTGLMLHHIGMRTWDVSQHQSALIVNAMATVHRSVRHGKTLVHCAHGADRTGLIIALWRILYQNWTREAAIKEMETGGFGFHPLWVNIPHYIMTVDLAALKRRIESAA